MKQDKRNYCALILEYYQSAEKYKIECRDYCIEHCDTSKSFVVSALGRMNLKKIKIMDCDEWNNYRAKYFKSVILSST